MPYLESIAALMARQPTLIKDPATFKFEDHLRVFALSKVGSIDTTIDVQNALEKAIANKQTLHDFLKANPNLVQNLGQKRLSRIFEYNKIYSHTRAKMLQFENTPGDANSENGDGWYYIFESMHDSAARHLAFDGVCLARKDPYWNTHTPPLDWGCRCQLHMVSKRGLKAFNESRGTNIKILEKAPSNLPAVDSKIAFEPNTYKYLQNFFKAKLESYAGNNQAKEKLSGVLKAIEEKKRRFKELVGLTKNQTATMQLATLSPEIIKAVGAPTAQVLLSGSTLIQHLEKHPETDLFDYYLAQDILEKPLAIFKDKQESTAPGALNTYLIGVKFGRWYRLAIGVNAGVNWFKSLLHSSKVRPLKKLMNSKKLIFKSDDFKIE
ncbi:phage minor head protein [Helicobacter suis]|uniref:phage head morphogenesis protein n=1 Tax=Helicobacter suis TaxID=104628 RepID=UPI0013D02CFB|nr:phage minor head protein [Helicobacter suis]